MRVAHFSDLHVLALEGVRLPLPQQAVHGWVNLRLKRAPSIARARARGGERGPRAKVDHVVITGDLTNLALEQEFEAVRKLIEDELGLAPDADPCPATTTSTRGARCAPALHAFFFAYLEAISRLCADIPLGRFPFVKLRARSPSSGCRAPSRARRSSRPASSAWRSSRRSRASSRTPRCSPARP